MKRFGDFLFDPEAGVLRGTEGEVRLRPKTYALLRVLLDAAPAIVGKDALLDRIWGQGHLGDTSLAQAVSELRRALGDEAKTPRFIETVHRRGYRFIAPISETDPPGATTPAGLLSATDDATAPDRPGTARAGRASPPARPRAVALLTAALAVVLVAFAGLALRRSTTADTPVPAREADPPSVLRVAVVAAVESLDPTAVPPPILHVVPSFLAPALQRNPRIQVYPETRVAAMTRDLGRLVAPDAAAYRRRVHYLQADHLVVGSIGRPEHLAGNNTGFAIGLTLVDRSGEASALVAPTVFDPDALGTAVMAWERAVTEAVGLRPGQRPTGAMIDLDWTAFEHVVAAKRQRSSDPASALAALERLQVDRLNGVRVGRLRVELHLALGEGGKARQLADQMRRRGSGFRRQVWYLNRAGRPSAALALLGKRRAELPTYAEDWLETLQTLAASDRPDDAETALRTLAQLPRELATSWVGAELRLVEAQLAARQGDHPRQRRAAEAALALAEPAGLRQTTDAARAMLASGAVQTARSP